MKPLVKRAALWMLIVAATTTAWLCIATPYFARTQFAILIGKPADLLASCETPAYAPEARPACRTEARRIAAEEPAIRAAFWRNSLWVAVDLAGIFWAVVGFVALVIHLATRNRSS